MFLTEQAEGGMPLERRNHLRKRFRKEYFAQVKYYRKVSKLIPV